jgi:ubiquinol-cytochrome c reductase cytochrome b subunit
MLLHGKETGRILRLANGEFVEIHEPVNEEEMVILTARTAYPPLPLPAKTDEFGVPTPKYRKKLIQAKISQWYSKGSLPIPTREEILSGQHHAKAALEQAQVYGIEPGKEEEISHA